MFYNISVGWRKTGIVQKNLAFNIRIKFIASLLKHLNNKCNHNKGLCKKNEYCKGLYSQGKYSTLDWPQCTKHMKLKSRSLLVDHVATVQKVTAPKAVPSNLPKLLLNKVLKL